MEKFSVLAKVTWYFEGEYCIDHFVLTWIPDFTEAIHEIEEYYGTDIVNIELTVLADPFVTIDADLYERLKTEAV